MVLKMLNSYEVTPSVTYYIYIYKSIIIGLDYLYIFSMFAKFKGNQRSIAISSINCLKSSFYSLKYCIKYEFMNQIVNNI